MPATDKHEIFSALRTKLQQELELARSSQRQTEAGATHEESKPENDKDTRALEASYLARGQARRVLELEKALAKMGALAPRNFTTDAPAALGAVVLVETEEGLRSYLLAPAGGGLQLSVGTLTLTVVTPQSPVGRALLGRRAGDDVDIRTPEGVRECSVAEVL